MYRGCAFMVTILGNLTWPTHWESTLWPFVLTDEDVPFLYKEDSCHMEVSWPTLAAVRISFPTLLTSGQKAEEPEASWFSARQIVSFLFLTIMFIDGLIEDTHASVFTDSRTQRKSEIEGWGQFLQTTLFNVTHRSKNEPLNMSFQWQVLNHR